MANKFLIVCGGSGVGLLGQRRVLGVSGELHIDVRSEVDDNLAKNDERSMSLKLDLVREAGMATRLLYHMKDQVAQTSDNQAYKRHTNYIADRYSGDVALEDGLARFPALGGLAIRHQTNTQALDAKLRTMIEKWALGVGTQTPLVFWIIASTAGGTGEGIHRFVGERIVKILSTKPGARVKLHFVRIGPGTYNEVDPEKTRLNTFFGIAADAAFKVRIPREYPRVNIASYWYYLEVPPAGVGSAVKPLRARLVEMACKALMLEELQEDINTIVVNDGIGLVRVGYWGRDFNQMAKYSETLSQLITKLTDMIEPNGYAKYVADNPEPKFEPGETMLKIKSMLETGDVLKEKMEKYNWQFPKFTAAVAPTKRAEILKMVPAWKNAIDRLIAPDSVDRLGPIFLISRKVTTESGEEAGTRLAPLAVPGAPAVQFSKEWFERVDTAQRVKAWGAALLGTGEGAGLLASLVQLAQNCSRAQHPPFPESINVSLPQKVNNLRNYLWDFIETLVKVVRLTELTTSVDEFLSSQLVDAKNVLDLAKREWEAASKAVIRGAEDAPVIAAELNDPLDQLTKDTWLKMLDVAVKRQDVEMFKNEVLRGATGLTRPGLLSVLGIPRSNAGVDEIKDALRTKMGRMYDRDGAEYEAQWWCNSPAPEGEREFHYRILPKLDVTTRAELGKGEIEGKKEIKYLYTELGVIGLNVLAFEGVSIAKPQDTVTTPKYLLTEFVPLVQEHLQNWVDVPIGRVSSKLTLASAGVGGEPLYKPPLVELLKPEEFEKLKEFYEFYDPNEPQESVEESVASPKEKPVRKTPAKKAKNKTR